MQQNFGNAAALIALGAALNPAAQQLVNVAAEAGRAKEAEAEALYRDWLEIANERIVAEQLLLGTATTKPYTLSDEGKFFAGEQELFLVLAYFDTMSAELFTRRVDVGELSNYLAADARRWRTLLRDLRERSSSARDTARYEQLTRALAAIEFLSSEPISDADRQRFALVDVSGEPDESSHSIWVSGEIRSRTKESEKVPNIAVCLRDRDGNVCGEAVLAPPVAEMQGHKVEPFTARVETSAPVSDIEVMFTRRAVADGP